MTVIRQDDLIDSVADALQFISCYHPLDFIKALHQAYLKEESQGAKDAMAQILINSRMCAEGKRPMCQDTGIVTIFIKVGMNVQWEADMSVTEMVNEGVRRAYLNPDNVLRASIVTDPAGTRQNTGDNTPASIHYELVPGDTVDVRVAAKGGGSENKSRMAMLNPSDNIVDWVKKAVPKMGAGWCPPGMLGIGIGGTLEKAAVLAKESLMSPIDIHELRERGPQNRIEELRLEIMDAVNALGIGAQGLGGLTTVLDVKIKDHPTHAASLPVVMIPNCAATRHTHFKLEGTGPSLQTPPNLDDWPEVTLDMNDKVRRVNLNELTHADIQDWKLGETILLSGKILTLRDVAHKRIVAMIERGEPLPVNLKNRFVYYVGPVDPVRDEIVGPAGPTTASRMDKFTETLLAETGMIGMIGKAERGPDAIAAIKKHKAVYLIGVGGAAYLASRAITAARAIAFPELGMEAIYEFELENMPVGVAIDVNGKAIHIKGPSKWQAIIKERAGKLS